MKPTREGLPVLVMIHGFMSGGIQFVKMMRHLRNYYQVVTIDLLGMGASGRPSDVEFSGYESCINFFDDSIQQWARLTSTGQNGEKFHLLGHSLGGLIAGNYALRHPEQVDRLVLMSSVGVSEKPAYLEDENFVS